MIKASAPHLVWAFGHFLTFIAGVRYLIASATFSWTGYDLWYKFAYFGAIISYGVVIYKSFGVPRTDRAYVQRALMDENVQYLAIAIYWSWIKPISIIPATRSADGTTQVAGGNASKFIQTWVKENYDRAMRFVSYAEVAIFARVFVGALLLRNSLIAPLLYAHFLRLRFYMSSFTRAAFQHVRSELDGLTQSPTCPPVVRKGYLTLTDLVSRYASTVLSINQEHAGGPTAVPSTASPAADAKGGKAR
ncbi:hypothetical protein MCUN1_001374 [Malassezia cuniculi]|uniref:Endoplasmic reticulum protein n=1 Tax=Malassezia cuniculi TaxID=948313 RepID=A0AAF0EPM6_9BASI|nr:hypothetical protein MCUN1_001374 [Malassezia cuniculi]